MCLPNQMTHSSESDILNRVQVLLSEHTSHSIDEIQSNTLLCRDLGMFGDDAYDFMRAYSSSLDVDMTGYNHAHYFPPETGCNPVVLLLILISGRPLRYTYRDIPVGHLVRIAINHKWVDW